MLTLMDWLVQLERSRLSLPRTGQERLARLAYSQEKVGTQAKRRAQKKQPQVSTSLVRCCPEAAA